MAFNGSGVFNRVHNFATDKTNLVPVTASRMDAELDGIATGLSTAITKDGQTTITASIPWNSQGLTGVGVLTVTGSTASTSTATGAVIVTGGVGIGGAVFTGGALSVGSTTASTSTTTGAAIIGGGAGVAGRVSADNFRATNQPCFSAHKNGTHQTGITDGTFTKVTLTTEAFDIGSFYDAANSRWTPPAGMVAIDGGIFVGATTGAELMTTNGAVVLSLYKNGVRYKDSNTFVAALGAGFAATTLGIVDRANGTDYYELFIFGTTTTTFRVDGTANNTYFMGSVI